MKWFLMGNDDNAERKLFCLLDGKHWKVQHNLKQDLKIQGLYYSTNKVL